MYIPKRYGETRVDSCPFCGRAALIKNPQGIAVCKDHKDKTLDNMKCACGEYLLMQQGKFGAFFNCFKCGNINLKKTLEINSHLISKSTESEKVEVKRVVNNIEKKEFVKKFIVARDQIVRSDDPRYF
jgi:hypothetical protein